MGQLEGKVAVVTGSSEGIGKAIALRFVEEGAKVVFTARSMDKLEALVKQVKDKGGEAIAVRTDVTVEADVVNLFKVTKETYGRLDILVNNAGMGTGMPTHEMPTERWQKMIDTNLNSVFMCSREALKIMKPQKSGRIIMIGSISAKTPRPNGAPYATTKHAIEGLAHSICLDYRDDHITASIVRVGSTMSNFVKLPHDQLVGKEYVMEAETVADMIVMVAKQRPEVNIYEITMMPTEQRSFIGRG